MSKNEWKKLVGVTGRMLLAFVFVFSQTASAGQNPQTKDKVGAPQKATAQQAGEKQSAAAPAAKAQSQEAKSETSESAVAEEKPSGSGSHEGINVHGHWTIEVRNPDGSFVRHVEFENALDPGFTTTSGNPGGLPIVVSGGASYLSGILSGRWAAPGSSLQSFTNPISWIVLLVGPAGLSNLATTTNAPCAIIGANSFPGACQIFPPPCANLPAGSSCNLSVTPLGTSPNFTGIQLTGNVSATQAGQISTVATLMYGPACATYASNCAAPTTALASITSSTNFPGAPISVTAGQMIAVTVVISFS
jgi:hypothetical protein